MRILVCGGRAFNDYGLLSDTLNTVKPTLIIEGGASGADTLAYRYAKRNFIERMTVQAKWDEQGKGAGPIRNQKMLEIGKPDLVIAFPGGKGTADMVRRAKRAGVEVREIV